VASVIEFKLPAELHSKIKMQSLRVSGGGDDDDVVRCV
jgi:hypothetical protein